MIAPHFLQGIKRFKWRRRWTHDSGETPDVVVQAARTLNPQDIDRLESQLNGKGRASELPKPPKILRWDSTKAKVYREKIIDLVTQKPRNAVELSELTGLSVSQSRTLCQRMREEGEISSRGNGRASKYYPASSNPSPSPEERDGSQLVAIPDERDTSLQEIIGSARDKLSSDALNAIEVLTEIDRIARESGLATEILTARYLEVLLNKIESGDFDPALLDRFERVAGLAPQNQSAPS